MKTLDDLLAAAKLAKTELPGMNGRIYTAFMKAIGDDEASDKYNTLNRECDAIHKQIDNAIAAAVREIDVRRRPVDIKVLTALDWVFSRPDNQWKHQTERLWFSIETGKLCIDCFATVNIESTGQLLDLLKGLGITS